MAVGVSKPLFTQGQHGVRTQFKTEELLRHVRLTQYTAIRLLALRYANEVKRLMKTSPRGGRVYVIRGKRHRSSAPGQPPAIRTGTLYRAIGFFLEDTPTGWRADVGIKVASPPAGSQTPPHRYGWYLEWGTSKMAPRPAWRPALGNIQGRFREIVGQSGLRLRGGTAATTLGQE